jgi:hypothetical protein
VRAQSEYESKRNEIASGGATIDYYLENVHDLSGGANLTLSSARMRGNNMKRCELGVEVTAGYGWHR